MLPNEPLSLGSLAPEASLMLQLLRSNLLTRDFTHFTSAPNFPKVLPPAQPPSQLSVIVVVCRSSSPHLSHFQPFHPLPRSHKPCPAHPALSNWCTAALLDPLLNKRLCGPMADQLAHALTSTLHGGRGGIYANHFLWHSSMWSNDTCKSTKF
jgi:hypothetical protein